MVIRKNISLESSHIKKIESLTTKHNGNLSAAIRDAIDLTDVSLRRYGSVEEAISKTVQWYIENRFWWDRIVSGEYQKYYQLQYTYR